MASSSSSRETRSARRHPYAVPSEHDLPDRLRSVVLSALYRLTEATSFSGASARPRRAVAPRRSSSPHAACELMPRRAGGDRLLALMLLAARAAHAHGDDGPLVSARGPVPARAVLVTHIAEGLRLVDRASRGSTRARGRCGPAIRRRGTPGSDAGRYRLGGDRPLYAALLTASHSSPVVEAERAAAIAFADGYDRSLCVDGDHWLDGYHTFTRARRPAVAASPRDDAATAYRRALELFTNAAERGLPGAGGSLAER